jgi:hypothetical protein
MVLPCSLPPPADPRVTANCHSAGFLLRRTDAISSASPKPPNPLSLNLFLSARYAELTHAKPIGFISLVFSGLTSENGPFFRRSQSHRCTAVSATQESSSGQLGRGCGREKADRKSLAERAGSKNMPTNEAGMCLEISNLPIDFRIGFGRTPLCNRTAGAHPGAASRDPAIGCRRFGYRFSGIPRTIHRAYQGFLVSPPQSW